MGGRGGSGRSSAAIVQMPVMDTQALESLADADIRDAAEMAIDSMHNPDQVRERDSRDHGPWISLLRLRTALSTLGWDRERQDRELHRFFRQRKANLIPESNQKALTKAHRDAALNVGREDKHLIAIKKQ